MIANGRSASHNSDIAALKLINDSIGKSISRVKQVLLTFTELYQQLIKLPFKERPFRKS